MRRDPLQVDGLAPVAEGQQRGPHVGTQGGRLHRRAALQQGQRGPRVGANNEGPAPLVAPEVLRAVQDALKRCSQRAELGPRARAQSSRRDTHLPRLTARHAH